VFSQSLQLNNEKAELNGRKKGPAEPVRNARGPVAPKLTIEAAALRVLGVDQLGQPLPVAERGAAVENDPRETGDLLFDQASIRGWRNRNRCDLLIDVSRPERDRGRAKIVSIGIAKHWSSTPYRP